MTFSKSIYNIIIQLLNLLTNFDCDKITKIIWNISQIYCAIFSSMKTYLMISIFINVCKLCSYLLKMNVHLIIKKLFWNLLNVLNILNIIEIDNIFVAILKNLNVFRFIIKKKFIVNIVKIIIKQILIEFELKIYQKFFYFVKC